MSQSTELTEVRLSMAHWWLDCECGIYAERCFSILGQEYMVAVPWCQQDFNRSVGRDTVDLVEEASGYCLIDQAHLRDLYAERTGRWGEDKLAHVLRHCYQQPPPGDPAITPVWQSGHHANGRRYYLLRDLVRHLRGKRLCPLCTHCRGEVRRPRRGQPFRAVTNNTDFFPWSAFERDLMPCLYRHSYEPDFPAEIDSREVIYCTRECRRNHWLAVLASMEARLEQKKQLRCMRKQVTALRRFARTGDKTVFDDLPEGYGPDRTTESC